MKNKEARRKLTGKDLVTVGIYTAIYFVMMIAVGFLGFIPIFIPLLAVIVPILGESPLCYMWARFKSLG